MINQSPYVSNLSDSNRMLYNIEKEDTLRINSIESQTYPVVQSQDEKRKTELEDSNVSYPLLN